MCIRARSRLFVMSAVSISSAESPRSASITGSKTCESQSDYDEAKKGSPGGGKENPRRSGGSPGGSGERRRAPTGGGGVHGDPRGRRPLAAAVPPGTSPERRASRASPARPWGRGTLGGREEGRIGGKGGGTGGGEESRHCVCVSVSGRVL
jgi:hypothetical protein